MPDDLVTMSEAAEHAGIKPSTMRHGAYSSRAVQIHYRRGQALVSLADVQAWRARVKRGRPPGRKK